jgi:hypothetical protein
MSAAKSRLQQIKDACAAARLDWDAILDNAREGGVQFHETARSVAVTCITTSGPFKTCFVVVVAGELDDMADLEAKVERFARANECQCIEADARPGWSRIRPPAEGYKQVAIKYRKNLE